MSDSDLRIAVNGVIGSSASALAVLTTFQENLEFGLRVLGSVLGIVTSVISIVRILRKTK
jgi:hypothetical protein